MVATKAKPAALVLAGTRRGGDPFAAQQGVAHKGLIEIGGRTLLERVIAGLRAADVDRIAVSADDPQVCALSERLGCETVAPGAGPSASVALAFEKLDAPMIVTTSDHALLRGEWVNELIDNTPEDADLSVMLAEREKVESAMPGAKRTYLRFADGSWSGCNLFYLQTAEARRAIDTWSIVETDRKRPWRIAARLGIGTLFSMMIGRLTLAEALARLGRRFGVKAALVTAEDGLAAVDVDKRADLEAVEALLKAPEQRASAPDI